MTKDNSGSCSFDESSLDAAPQLSPRRNSISTVVENVETAHVNVNDNMMALMNSFSGKFLPSPDELFSQCSAGITFCCCFFPLYSHFLERENEINYLKHRKEATLQKHQRLNKQISDLKERKRQLTRMTSSLKEEEKRYQKNMSKFWSIVSMFVTVKSET